MKLCECGCGLPAPIAPYNHKGMGWVKGQPMRFVRGHYGRVAPKIPAEIRFLSKVDKSAGHGPNGSCWMWIGTRSRKSGHGSFYPEGRTHIRAHRFSWMLHKGQIPEGLSVLHHCDNGACVNPEHLFTGTLADNNHDRNAKGRQAKGSKCGRAKLNEAKVIAMRQMHSSGIGHKRLAKQFGVSGHAARMAILGRTWKHLNQAGT